MFIHQCSLPKNRVVGSAVEVDTGFTYFTVSFSLNLLLTSMIIIRLILHRRNIRSAMGASAGADQLYGTVITMLIESSAFYAISFLLFFGPWAAGNSLQGTFWSILFEFRFVLFTVLLSPAILGQCYLILLISRSSRRFSSPGVLPARAL